MAALRSLLFALVFYGGTVMFVLVAIAAALFGRGGVRAIANAWARFHAAFAGLYRALDLPIVPLALDSGRLWGRTLLGKKPGQITFRFGDPIPPGLPRKEAEARVHAAINALNG